MILEKVVEDMEPELIIQRSSYQGPKVGIGYMEQEYPSKKRHYPEYSLDVVSKQMRQEFLSVLFENKDIFVSFDIVLDSQKNNLNNIFFTSGERELGFQGKYPAVQGVEFDWAYSGSLLQDILPSFPSLKRLRARTEGPRNLTAYPRYK